MDGNALKELLILLPRKEAKPKDCDNCMFRLDEWRTDGHCYFYSSDIKQDYCGQFENLERPTKTLTAP